jgi:hypothetical protein
VIRIAFVVICLPLIAACVERACEVTLIHTQVTAANELWGQVNDAEPSRLLAEAQAYRPLLSPDAKWLAVEVQQMSDLQLVRLFHRDGTKLVASDANVTAVAWQAAAAAGGFKPDELIQPRAWVAGWGDDGKSLSIGLSGSLPGYDRALETIVAVPLAH